MLIKSGADINAVNSVSCVQYHEILLHTGVLVLAYNM